MKGKIKDSGLMLTGFRFISIWWLWDSIWTWQGQRFQPHILSTPKLSSCFSGISYKSPDPHWIWLSHMDISKSITMAKGVLCSAWLRSESVAPSFCGQGGGLLPTHGQRMGSGKNGDQMGLRERQKVNVLCCNLWELHMILSKMFLVSGAERT